jgi:hypothetical protein
MSGLIGWFGRAPHPQGIAGMAQPLQRQHPCAPRTAANGAGAVALVAGAGAGSVLEEDGLLVAAWGAPAHEVARLWRARGPALGRDLAGAWAVAIVSARTGELLLAVDRLASRPLVFQRSGNDVAFASSAQVLLGLPAAHADIDPQAVFDYLVHHCVPPGSSLFTRQHRLGPGEYLHVRAGRAERRTVAMPALHVQEGCPAPWRTAVTDPAALVQRLARVLDQPCGLPLALPLCAHALQLAAGGASTLECPLVLDAAPSERQRRYRRYEQVPVAVRQLLVEPALFGLLGPVRAPVLERCRGHVRQCLAAVPVRLEADLTVGRYGGAAAVAHPDLLDQVDCGNPRRQLRDAYWASYGAPARERIALMGARFELAGALLPALLGACALAGVEPDVPALDAARMPVQLTGAVSAAPWFSADARLRELAFDSLIDLKRRQLVRPALLDRLLAADPAQHAELVWSLMSLEQWFSQRRAQARYLPP